MNTTATRSEHNRLLYNYYTPIEHNPVKSYNIILFSSWYAANQADATQPENITRPYCQMRRLPLCRGYSPMQCEHVQLRVKIIQSEYNTFKSEYNPVKHLGVLITRHR